MATMRDYILQVLDEYGSSMTAKELSVLLEEDLMDVNHNLKKMSYKNVVECDSEGHWFIPGSKGGNIKYMTMSPTIEKMHLRKKINNKFQNMELQDLRDLWDFME